MAQKLLTGLLGLSLALSCNALAETKADTKVNTKVETKADQKVEPKADAQVEPKAPAKAHRKAHRKAHTRHKRKRAPRLSLNQALLRDQSSLFTQGPTVTTSPYLGIRTEFDASDLIVNLPTMNEDLRLLEQQQKLSHRLVSSHLPFVERPIIELSGDVVGQAYWTESYFDNSVHDINLSDARFDILAHASSWVLAYISFNFDNSRLDDDVVGSGFRVGNSSLFLKRAFLTIGNLDCSPVYFSLGQMYVPFGRYSTSPVTSALTVALGQTDERAAVLGFSSNGFFASAYAFNGDSDVSSTGINQWGVNAGYKYDCDDFSIEFGSGYIANIADSTGMQLTGFAGTDQFQGFGFSNQTENLVHRVPAYDLHLELSFYKFSFNSEYIASTKSFDAVDLAYNDEGAMPSAFHIDGTYKFNICQYPSSFSLAYGFTEQALALNLPKQSGWATFKTSLFKNTIESLEYRYDENYASEDTSAGRIGIDADGLPISGRGPNGGGHRNTVVMEIGVYF